MTIMHRKICSSCASEKTTTYCEHCKAITPTDTSTEVFGKHRLRGLMSIKFGKGKKARMVRSGWKKSGDSKIIDGVYEDRIIDRRGDVYHQVVKDVSSGKILHQEHEKLSKHKSK